MIETRVAVKTRMRCRNGSLVIFVKAALHTSDARPGYSILMPAAAAAAR
jgi:hypothetical protein